jgi:perosamine synthetase
MEQVSWWRTNFGAEEMASMTDAMVHEHISHGPITAAFEEEIAHALGVPYAIVTTSGSVALLLALMALGIGRDDEVIVPNRTWIATAHAACLLGAKVILVDSLPGIPAMDMAQVRAKITPRTKAIMPVHLNGRAVDMEAVGAIAREHGLLVVEDACQALFSKNAAGYLGTQSDAGCFSLGVSKLISTGQGGIVVTRSAETYAKLKLVRNHGVVDNFTDTWNQVGFNFKFTDLLAAVGRVQLGRAPQRIAQVTALYLRYAEALAGLPQFRLIPVDLQRGELPLYVEILCQRRQELIDFLSASGIQARHSLPSLHTSPYLENDGDFPRSGLFAREGLYLPCGPSQTFENVDRVIARLKEFA